MAVGSKAESVRDHLDEPRPGDQVAPEAPEPLRRRFVRAASWAAAGTATSQAFQLAASIITARLLGKQAFGELAMVLSTTALFGQFAAFGLGLTGTKYIAEFRRIDPARAGRMMALTLQTCWATGALATLVCLLLAPWLAREVLHAPQLVPFLRWGAALILVNAIGGGYGGVLAGFEAFRAIAQVALQQGIVSLPVSALLVWRFGLLGAVWAAVVVAVTAQTWMFLAVRQQRRQAGIVVAWRDAWRERSVLWRFALPSFLGGAMVQPVNWVANAMLVNQPGGFGELAIFNAANRWRAALYFLPGVLGQSTVPILSAKYGEGDLGAVRKTLGASVSVVAAVTVPVACVLGALSPTLMDLNGSGFRQGWRVMIVCLATAVLSGTMTPIGNVLAATGRMWLGLAMNAGWAAGFLAAFQFLKDRGALGLALAFLVGYGLHAVWVTCYAIRAMLGRSQPAHSVAGSPP